MRNIIFGSATHVGMVRSENQDALGKFPHDNLDLSTPKGQLFIIADGMGGHAGGREASRIAVEEVSRWYFASQHEDILSCLQQAFKEGNRAIFEYSINNPQLTGMGTTCIALVMQNDSAYIAHIGDSRLYRFSGKKVEQLTTDHTKVAEMVRRGMISEEEARVHPERSMLYRAMGVRSDFQFDVMNGIALGANEYFLLCTDGLSGLVEPDEMSDVVLSHPPKDACTMLVNLANERGGHDNITVQIVQVKGEESFLNTLMK